MGVWRRDLAPAPEGAWGSQNVCQIANSGTVLKKERDVIIGAAGAYRATASIPRDTRSIARDTASIPRDTGSISRDTRSVYLTHTKHRAHESSQDLLAVHPLLGHAGHIGRLSSSSATWEKIKRHTVNGG